MKTKKVNAPRPWAVVKRNQDSGLWIMRRHPNDPAKNPGGDGMPIARIEKGWGPWKANAAHIVKAVNAHADLLDALRAAHDIAATTKGYYTTHGALAATIDAFLKGGK